MKAIACAPVFRLDDDGSIIGPSNNVFATPNEQVAPGVVLVSIELLNLVLHWGTREAVYERYAQRAADRERIATARVWIEGETPAIEPPFVARRCGHIVDNYTDEICGRDLPCPRHK